MSALSIDSRCGSTRKVMTMLAEADRKHCGWGVRCGTRGRWEEFRLRRQAATPRCLQTSSRAMQILAGAGMPDGVFPSDDRLKRSWGRQLFYIYERGVRNHFAGTVQSKRCLRHHLSSLVAASIS